MIIIEKSNFLSISRKTFQVDSYHWEQDLEYVFIKEYQSIDIDKYNRKVYISINSRVTYNIACNDAKSLVKSLVRDGKLNEIIPDDK
jgi:hypothetical protein